MKSPWDELVSHGTFRAFPQQGYGQGPEVFMEKKGEGIRQKG
jgi:hypothetical protein